VKESDVRGMKSAGFSALFIIFGIRSIEEFPGLE